MEREQIYTDICTEVEKLLPPEYRNAELSLQNVVKANGYMYKGLTILPESNESKQISPCINLDKLLEKREGIMSEQPAGSYTLDIYNTAREVLDIWQKNMINNPFSKEQIGQFMEYGYAKEHLTIRPFDPDMHRDVLPQDQSMMLTAGDFSGIFYVADTMPGSSGSEQYSIKVTPQLMQMWGVDMETMKQDTLENMAKDARLFSMMDMIPFTISEVQGFEQTEPKDLLAGAEGNSLTEPMYVLTNQGKCGGAGVMFSHAVLEQVSELAGGDYYVLPSSVHELIIVPAAQSPARAEELQEMVRQVNQTAVAEDEILSDKVHRYDSGSHALVNAIDRDLSHGAVDMEMPGMQQHTAR